VCFVTLGGKIPEHKTPQMGAGSDLDTFPDNVAGQYVMTYEYAKLDLLYTISTIYN